MSMHNKFCVVVFLTFGKNIFISPFFVKDILLDIEFLFDSFFSITINLNISFHVPLSSGFFTFYKEIISQFYCYSLKVMFFALWFSVILL